MKKKGHPFYNITEASCACGNKFLTGSTSKNVKVEICSKCHPFFTGKQKFIDSAGRIERFYRKYSQLSDFRNKSEELKKQRLASDINTDNNKNQS